MSGLLCVAIIVVLFIVLIYYRPSKITKPINVLLFYRDGCPYCEVFKPEWVIVENALKDKAKKFNTADPKFAALATQYNVTGVPSIILTDVTGAYETYLGSRTADSIISRLT